MHGIVEVDQSYLAVRDRRVTPVGKGTKGLTAKAIVVIAVEILVPKGFGRIRLQRIVAASGVNIVPFVREVVEPGSVLRTDGAAIYRELRDQYQHEQTVVKNVIRADVIPAHIPLPGVHRVASLLKRWLLGTHQGAVKPVQLEHYLDEFVFRFYRRTSRSRGLVFHRLLEQAVQAEPITYRRMVKRTPRQKILVTGESNP